MKKIFAILISLLFIASVFGVASTTATSFTLTATPTTVAVGDIITVTYDKDYGSDPAVVAYGTLPKGDVVKVSGPTYKAAEGLTYWTYRATKVGTIVFETGAPKTGPVTITPKSHPMFSFMNILGFGKKK